MKKIPMLDLKLALHLYGRSCQMDEIMEIAKEYKLFVLEDVAQAFGAMWSGKKLGTIGAAGVFSFFPSKNLGGFGDGGMVGTDDDEIAELVRMLLRHGGKDKYNVAHIGYNARLDTLQAAIILAKLEYLDEFNGRRRKIAEIYNKELAGVDGLVLPITNNQSPVTSASHVYHQYTIKVLDKKGACPEPSRRACPERSRRNELQEYLRDKGISTMVYYPVPLHKMKVFDKRCRMPGGLAEAERAVKEILSLPIEPLMTEDELSYVCETIRRLVYSNSDW